MVLSVFFQQQFVEEKGEKLEYKDTLRIERIELKVCQQANDSLQKVNRTLAEKHKEIMDFRHGSHDLRDSLISKNYNKRMDYGYSEIQ